MAVHMIAQGQVGHMAALRNGRMTAIPMSDAVSQQKQVPLDSDLVRTALGLNICLGSHRQALVVGQERDRQ
jgi:hypothetical protein